MNELECASGVIYANLLEHRHIVRIDAQTGEVTGAIDTGYLLLGPGVGDYSAAGVLNGIALLPGSGQLLLTGKNWPRLFEVSLVPLAEFYASQR